MINNQVRRIKPESDYYSQVRKWPSLFNIRKGSKILDIGCGNGILGEYLQSKYLCQVTGIDIVEECVIRASKVLYKSFQGNIETMDLGSVGSEFDYIIFSDSLEHLIDTTNVLKSVKKLMAHGGSILIAIPNTRNFRVTFPLLFLDQWEYQDEGLLDRTHLRFFTGSSIREHIESCGYEVEKILLNLPLSSKVGKINALTLGLFRSHLTSHYYIKACLKRF
jgi:2-polyprenyl-3-methyl-5-hydroxy-6-metoxy-1,4-benzoquinol methylase